MMEIKKIQVADLNRRRGTGFLLGLIVALSLCFSALELTTSSNHDDTEEELLDDIAQDLEQLPALDQKDMMAVVAPQEIAPASEKLVERKISDPLPQTESSSSTTVPQPIMPVEVPPDITEELMKVPPVPLDLHENPLQLRVVQNAPEPSIGWVPFMKWITKTLKYPPTAKVQKIQGTVFVTFIVNVDGTVSNINVNKSVEASLDREALRVVGMMPKWKAGISNGQPTRSMVGIPIVFKL